MVYESNDQLLKEIKKLLVDIGVSKRELAAGLDMSPQCLQSLLGKKQFCFADLKRILDCLGYDLVLEFREKGEAV